ncbi:hypothetical protein BJY04DRAFT_226127 [Aspergillus karnatakaensis]|uniref:uncharacterized protein n=1 Tax=Aspergillus karnatakaensis TaxID=1810916 RepID=UPI003CCDA8C5
MRLIFPHLLAVCTVATLTMLATTEPTQQPMRASEDTIAREDSFPVPGHNNAFYDAVPKEEQVFEIEFLEIAPTPIIADRLFFIYLRGEVSESKKKEMGLPDGPLVDATITARSSAIYADGSMADEQSLTLPLKTMGLSDEAHLVIRDSDGHGIEYMSSSDRNDFLLDFQLPFWWLRSGLWTFKVDVRLGDADNTCLFALALTQWLDGDLP